MEMITMNVNWVAVLAGAAAAFMLGWLWYSPKMFGVKWAEGVGVKMDSANKMPMHAMVAQAIGTFLLAWAIGVTETTQNIGLTILIGLALAALVKANGLFAQKSLYAIKTEAGFVVAMVAVMILAQGLF